MKIIATIKNKKIKLDQESIIALGANFLATQAIGQGVNLSFKVLFDAYKDDLLYYYKNTGPNHIFDLLDNKWAESFQDYKKSQILLFAKDVVVTFSDGTKWAIDIIAFANLFLDHTRPQLQLNHKLFLEERDKALEDYNHLVEWCSDNISWSELYDSITVANKPPNKSLYVKEWPFADKKIEIWKDLLKEND